MKRCPECGFRAKDNICPLCGVRMTGISAAGRTLDTHAHRQPGEGCLLPEKEKKTIRIPTARERKRQKSPNAVSIIVVVIIVILMRSCAA